MAAHDTIEGLLLRLRGGDPFADVAASAPSHRDEHGAECGLYPAGPAVMSLAGSFACTAQARTILDLGCGTGYSSLWLAHSTPTASRVDAVDRSRWHIDLARHNAATHGLDARISFHEADAADYLTACDTRYDLIHDDAWFAHEPSYLEVMIRRLEPGGVLTMPNWFLLTEAFSDHPSRDWSEFAGSDWQDATLRYARRLAGHPELDVNWITDPPWESPFAVEADPHWRQGLWAPPARDRDSVRGGHARHSPIASCVACVLPSGHRGWSAPGGMTMDFTLEGLATDGFAGFVAWNDLLWDEVPASPGVYVVVTESPDPPEILSRNPAGWFKGRDPTVGHATLEAEWVEGCSVVYVGKAARLRTRLRQYRDHGQGRPVGHWGGRYIWQLGGSGDLRVAWKATDVDPRLLEQEMLAAFVERYGQLPFANLRR